VQFAHLCKLIRDEHNWTGTKQVAEYLGVSRATVSQPARPRHGHLKIRHHPQKPVLPSNRSEKQLANRAL
jgi:hypothetical protein